MRSLSRPSWLLLSLVLLNAAWLNAAEEAEEKAHALEHRLGELHPGEAGLRAFLFSLSEILAGEVEGLDPPATEDRLRLEEFVRDVRKEVREGTTPEETIASISRGIYDRGALRPVPDDEDIRHLFPHDVLREGEGPCLPLSALYLIAARETDLPLYGVLVPGHFFVRFDDGRTRINIETLKKGVSIPDGWYAGKYRVPSRGGAYLRSLSTDETAAVYMFNSGNILKDRGRWEAAEAFYRRSLEMFPLFAGAHGNLGVVLLEQGRLDDAVAEFRLAVEHNPLMAGAYLNLGVALQRQDRLEEALSVYRRGLSVAPRDPALLHAAGTIHHRWGALGKAVSFYRKALDVRPDFSSAHRDLAKAYGSMGRYRLAREHQRKSQTINKEGEKGGEE